MLAKDGEQVVGASTASPLMAHTKEFAPLFEKAGFNPERVFYFGESVLVDEYRGQGIGVAFFNEREKHARELGRFDIMTFCGVVRDKAHPAKPSTYVPLDEFWIKRGFRKHEGLTASYSWKEIGANVETDHPMQFWVKRL